MNAKQIDFDKLTAHLVGLSQLNCHSIHGVEHWRRVERNGLEIARTNGADETVIRLFAIFHDSCRWNDGHDPQHGQRGAELAIELHEEHFEVEPVQLELLVLACQLHHQGAMSEDPTIGACFDADRLDLPRVGIIPDPKFLNTEQGIAMAHVIREH